MYTLSKESWSTKTMVKISVLGVISFILMFFEIPMPWLAPTFMKIDISDLPALIGSFAIGPMAGVIIQLLKNVLNLLIEGSTTGGVGELANFVVGAVFAYTAGFVYYKNKTIKRALIGLILGTVLMTIVITLANYFIMFPFYAKLFGMEIQALVDMGAIINKNIVDLKSMMLIAVVPFNLLKGAVLTVITMLIYKRVSPILHK
ncbi:ECF transporter S component [Tissierella sp.]|uniref:ECF transporter S component n=1 Tax=Tissierella sp. TaxID=41274 RepID=UPI0028610A90|nr:ECF transporter S component [Tissierella sp.]MDR7856860.1 ECF transporter S component [Tissierella sp.]